MSGETKEVFGSNYGQNDVIINGLIVALKPQKGNKNIRQIPIILL